MPYLGVNLDRASDLVVELQGHAQSIDAVVEVVERAQSLADLPLGVTLLLGQVGADLDQLAVRVDRARSLVMSFRLTRTEWGRWVLLAGNPTTQPAPTRTPVPIFAPNSRPRVDRASTPPRWDAHPDQRWNHVHQEASHNSYETDGGVTALFAAGVRTFELDIHRGAPTEFFPEVGPPRPRSWLKAVIADHFDHAGGRPADWRVYHVSGSSESEYAYLSEGLDAVAALDTSDPLTVFIDNKDEFAASHTGSTFDEVLRSSFGDRLYTPADLRARAPQAATLYQALESAGWPTVQELEGRVIVVLTDEVADYELDHGLAFVAVPPRLERSGHGFAHAPDPNVVFYNAPTHWLDDGELAAMRESLVVLRTYVHPRCPAPTIEERETAPNYRAADIEPSGASCPIAVPAPPPGVPGPSPNLGRQS